MTETTAVDLDALGRRAGEPDLAVAAAVRQWLIDHDRGTRLGRLVELAAWWAGVAGHAQAPPPARTAWGLETFDPLGAAAVPAPEAGAPGEVATTDPDQGITAALSWGLARADELADTGTDLILLAIQDTPQVAAASLLLAADLLALDPVESIGWPTDGPDGLDDEAWMDAVVDLRDGLFRTRGLRGDLTALLAAAGSLELAAATALLVQACIRRTPVLLDGDNALAAALLARRAVYGGNLWWQCAHAGDTELSARVLASLQLQPVLDLGLAVQDGTGARLALPILVEAAGLLR